MSGDQAKHISQNNIFKKYLQHVKSINTNQPPSIPTTASTNKRQYSGKQQQDSSNRSKGNMTG
ncbi:hypothetical protein COB52_05115, partial [Candidatus Kaiserbacteria bacterium]